MRSILLVVVAGGLAACGSGSKAKPNGGEPPAVRVPKTPPRKGALRNDQLCPTLVTQVRQDSHHEDPEVDAIVMQHCQRWPVAIQRCVATSKGEAKQQCLAKLDPAKASAFRADMKAALSGPPECDAIVSGPTEGWIALPPEASGEARAANEAAVRRALATACRDSSWPAAARKCITKGTATPRTCLEKLDPDVGARVDAELKLRADLFAKAAAFKATDSKIKCERVAAAHYGDAQWKGKLGSRKAADRKRLMKDSNAALLAACKRDDWSAYVRGCVIAAKGEAERGWCIDVAGAWAYPAASVGAAEPTAAPGKTGIPDCDVYIAAVERYITCSKIPQASRDASRQALDLMRKGWGPDLAPDAKKAAADACKAGTDAIKQGSTALGCPI